MTELTWEDLANIYDRHAGFGARKARTMPMNKIADWAESRKDLFDITEDGSFVIKEITE